MDSNKNSFIKKIITMDQDLLKITNLQKAKCDDFTLFSVEDLDRIIEMAWEDRTPFDAIEKQFGLKEAAVKAFMKKTLKFSSYKRWRIRVENCKTKHSRKRIDDIDRFKCTRQRIVSQNKISKR